jgi:hypothetical protein
MLVRWQKIEVMAEKLMFGTGLDDRGLELVGERVDEKEKSKKQKKGCSGWVKGIYRLTRAHSPPPPAVLAPPSFVLRTTMLT